MKQTIIDNRNRAVRAEDCNQVRQALNELKMQTWIVEEVGSKRRRVFRTKAHRR